MTINLSLFSPIADILLIEHRVCKKCGFGAYGPSPHIMRLFTSTDGLGKHILERRKPEDIPLPHRAQRVIEVETESCMSCWKATHEWDAVASAAPTTALKNRDNAFATAYLRAISRSAAPTGPARNGVASIPGPISKSTLESLI